MMMNPRKQRFFVLTLMLLVLSLPGASGMGMDASPQGFQASWKFAVISDTQGDNRDKAGKSCINDAVVQAIAADIVKEKPDFVLVVGDLVNGWFRNGGTAYSTQYANWKVAMMPVYLAGIRVYPIRGNHDAGPERTVLPPLPAHLEPPPGSLDLLREAFVKAFSEPYLPKNGPSGKEEAFTYGFTHKNAFIVALDQFGSHEHTIHQAWLDRQLSENRKSHVFAFGHEPAFQIRHKDCLAFYPQARDAFWDSIGRAGARVYFCGHDHLYNRAEIPDIAGNPVWQVVAGTGGGRLVPWSGTYPEGSRVKGVYSDSDHHGYLLVTVKDSTVTIEWKALVGNTESGMWKTLDSFTYTVVPGSEGVP